MVFGTRIKLKMAKVRLCKERMGTYFSVVCREQVDQMRTNNDGR